jgi:hypothetical protein
LLPLLKQMLLAAAAAEAGAEAVEEAAEAARAGLAGQQPRRQGQPLAAAYLATMLRHESTMQQFLDTVGADPDLAICQLAGPPGWRPVESTACGGAEAGDRSCARGATGRADAVAEAGAAGSGVEAAAAAAAAGGVRFQHLPELEATRGSIFLHRITLSPALLT